MPLYLPNNSVFFGSPTRLEAEYRVPARSTISGETGYVCAFFPGCGTEGYAYSVSMPQFWQYGNSVNLVFNGFDNGVVIYEDGIWTDPAYFVTSVGELVRVHFTVEGWLPIFNFPGWEVTYRIANVDGSVDPRVLIYATELADDSGYPGGLPSTPVITPRVSTAWEYVLEEQFDWDSYNLEPSMPCRAIGPDGQVWELHSSGSGCADRWGSGAEYPVADVVGGRVVQLNPLWKVELEAIDYESYFNDANMAYTVEIAVYFLNKTTTTNYIDFRDGDGYSGSYAYRLRVYLYSSGSNWYVQAWNYTSLQHSALVGALCDGVPAMFYLRIEHDQVNNQVKVWVKKDDGAWTEATWSPWSVSLPLPSDPGLFVIFGDNAVGDVAELEYITMHTAETVNIYSGGYLQIDFSSLSCSGRGLAMQSLDTGYALLTGLVIGAYQGNNERADLIIPMLTIDATAEWQEASMTLPSWHMGGYEDTYDAYGLMTFPSLTLALTMQYVYSCVPMRPGHLAYSFVQGVPSEIPDEYKPYILLYGSDYMEDLAVTVFWGLS